jgi:Immunoglobulin I-set domain
LTLTFIFNCVTVFSSSRPISRIPDGKSPRFPKKPTIRQEGEILIMECVLEAHPLPDIQWFQGQKSIADTSRIKMSRKAISKDTYLLTLEISAPTREDGGNYRCNAFNMYGESNANIALNFQGSFLVQKLICVYLFSNFFSKSQVVSISVLAPAIEIIDNFWE